MKSRSLKFAMPVAALVVAFAGFALMIATRPSVSTQVPELRPPLVRVMEVERRVVELSVRTHGTVAPRTESELVPEVSGPVVEMSPSLVSGGMFDLGEPLLRIEAVDYEAALESARAALARSESERRRATRALARTRDLAENDVASEAQLDEARSAARVAQARVREARAALGRAERDLARTVILAPYAGRVRSKRVDVGQFVSRGQSIATIYAIDFVEVRLPVPDEELAFVPLPGFDLAEDAALPRVTLRARFAGRDSSWEGRIVRTEGEIDPKSRMVHVVARVEDPYGRVAGRAGPPLAVGLFVEAEIHGRVVPDAVVLPRAVLRGGGRVLVVDEKGQLRLREVQVVRISGDRVVVSDGLSSGERVLLSTLQAPVDGMRVRAMLEPGTPARDVPQVDVAAPAPSRSAPTPDDSPGAGS